MAGKRILLQDASIEVELIDSATGKIVGVPVDP